MKYTNLLDEITKKLSAVLPDDVKKIRKDVEKNFHIILQSAFHKMDIITREEFDAQKKVLQRSRKKIEALEKKLKDLETLIKK